VVQNSGFFRIRPVYAILPPFLLTSLGRGEAAVIHTAVSEGIETVAIDERKGRRWARLHGLKVTGSLGIIVVLHRMGVVKSVAEAIGRMNAKGIFLSEALIQAAMDSANKP
jgi:predicted nucleic acid-binding protein